LLPTTTINPGRADPWATVRATVVEGNCTTFHGFQRPQILSSRTAKPRIGLKENDDTYFLAVFVKRTKINSATSHNVSPEHHTIMFGYLAHTAPKPSHSLCDDSDKKDALGSIPNSGNLPAVSFCIDSGMSTSFKKSVLLSKTTGHYITPQPGVLCLESWMRSVPWRLNDSAARYSSGNSVGTRTVTRTRAARRCAFSLRHKFWRSSTSPISYTRQTLGCDTCRAAYLITEAVQCRGVCRSRSG
jgi:hypothetical protein